MSGPFTYEHYGRMIRSALELGREFLLFTEFDADRHEKVVLLRHDIDVSLDAAGAMADVEAETGVRATYFIRLNSTFYNPFSQKEYPVLKRIVDHGHDIGLHFDPAFYQANGMEVLDGIRREKAALEGMIGQPVSALSQHRPYSLGMENHDDELFRYFAYADPFVKDCKYISDSGMRWREGDMLENLDDYPRLQVLVHPAWWGETEIDWRTRLRSLGDVLDDRVRGKLEILVERYGAYLDKREDA